MYDSLSSSMFLCNSSCWKLKEWLLTWSLERLGCSFSLRFPYLLFTLLSHSYCLSLLGDGVYVFEGENMSEGRSYIEGFYGLGVGRGLIDC